MYSNKLAFLKDDKDQNATIIDAWILYQKDFICTNQAPTLVFLVLLCIGCTGEALYLVWTSHYRISGIVLFMFLLLCALICGILVSVLSGGLPVG